MTKKYEKPERPTKCDREFECKKCSFYRGFNCNIPEDMENYDDFNNWYKQFIGEALPSEDEIIRLIQRGLPPWLIFKEHIKDSNLRVSAKAILKDLKKRLEVE